MIKSIFEIGDMSIKEVMVPRIDMVCARADQDLEEVTDIIIEKGYSRIPIYDGSIDNIVGIVHAKDILKFKGSLKGLPAIEVVRLPYFIPESKQVMDAMRELQKNKLSISIVLDEYGGVCGLVTMEDLVEEIVGELQDEFDKEEVPYKVLRDGGYLVNARMELDTFNRLFDANFQDADVNTLSGLILKQLERIPKTGETFKIDNFNMKIIEASQQRIYKVLVHTDAARIKKES
ncbi:MAG TPA: HlyC/CorC family transporter [bacterium (Candidatus Stahlbacteria)]|nr:HlyC/CorC family transporter [Candidatus Stahlbacteria bacterium]